MRLANKVAIVTGAGAGIGEAIAMRFAEEGARLVLADYKAEGIESLASKLKAEGKEAFAVQASGALTSWSTTRRTSPPRAWKTQLSKIGSAFLGST
jgi:NAD(P)-dependent dehydrogenase (short-subunit alcohol dehydrogenase family)